MPDGCRNSRASALDSVDFLLTAMHQNIPAICLNVGPMLNSYQKDTLAGSVVIV